MDFSFFQLSVLRPFTDWCIISAAWYFAKYCLKHEFIKDNYYIKWHQKMFILLCIGVPAFMIASLISIILEGGYKLSTYLAVILPALASCYWYIEKHNTKGLEETKALLKKEGLIK